MIQDDKKKIKDDERPLAQQIQEDILGMDVRDENGDYDEPFPM